MAVDRADVGETQVFRTASRDLGWPVTSSRARSAPCPEAAGPGARDAVGDVLGARRGARISDSPRQIGSTSRLCGGAIDMSLSVRITNSRRPIWPALFSASRPLPARDRAVADNRDPHLPRILPHLRAAIAKDPRRREIEVEEWAASEERVVFGFRSLGDPLQPVLSGAGVRMRSRRPGFTILCG